MENLSEWKSGTERALVMRAQFHNYSIWRTTQLSFDKDSSRRSILRKISTRRSPLEIRSWTLKATQGSTSGYARSISLPEVFRNLKTAKIFAVDIGGSLAKVAYMSEVRHIRKRHYSFTSLSKSDDEDSASERGLTEKTYYLKHIKTGPLKATGGGAHKYTDLLTSKLGVRSTKKMRWNVSSEASPPYVFQDHSKIFPYLLVNIGSGVSIIKVESENKFERVGGTSMGGGTFWGLGSLLTSAKGFDELLELATKGHHQNVDMLVRDIYGGAYDALKLPGDLTASSFGKTVRSPRDDHHDASQFARSRCSKKSSTYDLYMTLGRLVHCLALCETKWAEENLLRRIFHQRKPGHYARHFLRHQLLVQGKPASIVSQTRRVLRGHRSILKGADEDVEFTLSNLNVLTWRENYAGSSGLSSAKRSSDLINTRLADGVMYDVLEMDQFSHTLVPFPLPLPSPSDYFPDTQDLTVDTKRGNTGSSALRTH
ncbi:Pantothenate kinase 4 [Desmophyllum pertusum]|uniref:Pantothenate kinase 4 n=1 Tax=Desmophyllum pertusum TaxID=174260 RepID=A0A9W9YHF0_9CNID|nr:Pantothenate kinase 4 [Desmophyllum pertusum]